MNEYQPMNLIPRVWNGDTLTTGEIQAAHIRGRYRVCADCGEPLEGDGVTLFGCGIPAGGNSLDSVALQFCDGCWESFESDAGLQN